MSLTSSTGLTHNNPPPEAELSEVPPDGPPRFKAEGERDRAFSIKPNFFAIHALYTILRSDLTQKVKQKYIYIYVMK